MQSTLQKTEKEVVDDTEGEDNVAQREARRNHSKDYQEDDGATRKREDGDFSKDSLGVFSPVLSSTLAPHFNSNLSASSSHLSPNYIRNLRLPSEELEVAAQCSEEDNTAAKILRYRQILSSQTAALPLPSDISSPTPALSRNPSPTSAGLSPSRACLAQEWRSSLASLAGRSTGSSPSRLNTTPTPGAATEWTVETSIEGRGQRLDSEDMDSVLVSRLDMLMHNSMTLSDTSTIELDLSLGALCLDPGLLSPHSK